MNSKHFIVRPPTLRQLAALSAALGVTLSIDAASAAPPQISLPTPPAPVNPGPPSESLSVTTSAGAPVCVDSQTAVVEVLTTITGTGAHAGAVLATLDGGDPEVVGEVRAQDWSHTGPQKTANLKHLQTVSSGAHALATCFEPSAGHNPSALCAEPVGVTVECCSMARLFGNLMGNRDICRQAVPVHLKGDFGDFAEVTVTSDAGFSAVVVVERAGDSCVYHGRLGAVAGAGAGRYTFSAVGQNGQTYSFSRDMTCSSRGRR